MKTIDEFIQSSNLSNDPDDIDSLLEIAEITRQLISDELYSDINRIINYTITNSFFEAFSWIMDILQEEFESEDRRYLEDFTCYIGKSIMNYSEFVNRLQVDFNVIKNDVETALDNNGEVQSFFNILTYKTIYNNIFLVTSENFDTEDNDFIQYKLLFTRTPDLRIP